MFGWNCHLVVTVWCKTDNLWISRVNNYIKYMRPAECFSKDSWVRANSIHCLDMDGAYEYKRQTSQFNIASFSLWSYRFYFSEAVQLEFWSCMPSSYTLKTQVASLKTSRRSRLPAGICCSNTRKSKYYEYKFSLLLPPFAIFPPSESFFLLCSHETAT